MSKKDPTPNVSLVPMGTIVAFILDTAEIPPDWLLCDGSLIPTIYPLHDSITYTPNLAGVTLIGAGTSAFLPTTQFALDAVGGEFQHTLTMEEMPAHQHLGWGEKYEHALGMGRSREKDKMGSGEKDYDNFLYGSSFTGGKTDKPIEMDNGTVTGRNPGVTSPHNNMQPYHVVNYIIYAGYSGPAPGPGKKK